MGEFINQIQKNNQLQHDFITEKQRQNFLKEQRKKERNNEKNYKEVLKNTKKDLVNILYQKIELYFNEYGSSAYNLLNNSNTRKILIDEIFEDYPGIEKILHINDIELFKNDLSIKYYDFLKKQKSIFENIEKSKKSISGRGYQDAYLFLYNFLETYYKKYSYYIFCNLQPRKNEIINILTIEYQLNEQEKIKLLYQYDLLLEKFNRIYNRMEKMNLQKIENITFVICCIIFIIILISL